MRSVRLTADGDVIVPGKQRFPRRIRKLLAAHHAGGVTEQDCLACSASCCSQGGFAILENVLRIFELYQSGQLSREDHEFEAGLSFTDFVYKYFQVYRQDVEDGARSILLFHMKNLSSDGHLIGIPAVDDYWNVRVEMFKANPWLNRGCVFLSKSVLNWPHDDRDASRHCILHSKESGDELTAKPIDCVFYTCDTPINVREPAPEVSDAWFCALAREYPNSVERFDALTGDSGEAAEV